MKFLYLPFLLFPLTTVWTQESSIETVPLEIIEQQAIDLGDHAVIYNRVVPPAPPLSLPEEFVPATASQLSPLSIQQVGEKRYAFVVLSANVVDHSLTEISWSGPSGSGSAFSNLDFSYFPEMGEIDTPETLFSYWLITSPLSSADSAQRAIWQNKRQQLATLPPIQRQPSRYILDPSVNSAGDEASTVAAMHRHFDAHREQILADYQVRQSQLEREEALAKNPSPPPDTVINFWPIKSTVYPTESLAETTLEKNIAP